MLVKHGRSSLRTSSARWRERQSGIAPTRSQLASPRVAPRQWFRTRRLDGEDGPRRALIAGLQCRGGRGQDGTPTLVTVARICRFYPPQGQMGSLTLSAC